MTNPQQGWNNSLQPGAAHQYPSQPHVPQQHVPQQHDPQQQNGPQYGQAAASQYGRPAHQQYGQPPPYQQHPQPFGAPAGQPWPTLQPGVTRAVALDAVYPWGPPVSPQQPPADGRVVVAVNQVRALLIGLPCLAAGLGIFYWLWYMGNLFEFENSNGRFSKGAVFIQLLPWVLVIVALVMAFQVADRKPKLIFEPQGLQYQDRSQPGNMARRGWDQIGRVLLHRQANGKSTTEHWIVLDRQGGVLVNRAASGLSPKPGAALGQIAAISQGRAYVG